MDRLNILVDIGKVLLWFDFDRFIHAIHPSEPSTKRDNPALDFTTSDLANQLNQVLDLRLHFESGQMSATEFVAQVKSITHSSISDRDIVNAWCSVFTEIKSMTQFLPRWRQAGHRLILFSNTNPLHHHFITKNFSFIEQFDEGIFSHQVGSMKPNLPIYQYAIDSLGCSPSNTLYFDDLQENIATGRKFGFESHQINWTQPEQMTTLLESISQRICPHPSA